MAKRHYGIIGYPLGHTLSPALHNWGFAQHGIKAVYEAWPTRPEELETFMARVRTAPIFGVSVTIPHKRTVLRFVDRITNRAQAVGAVNTLFWLDGHLVGDNTDVLGCLAPLKALPRCPKSALILGAGGAARAATAACLELGVPKITVANRTVERAKILAMDLKISVIDWAERSHHRADLIINATPLGMTGEYMHLSPWPLAIFPARTVVFDLVYNPLQTRFLTDAQRSGCTTISGLSLFLHQGLTQFKLWTGQTLNPIQAEMRLKAELERQPK